MMQENGCLKKDDIAQDIKFASLSGKQQIAMNIIMWHHQNNQNELPFFMIIQGMVGTGKSYLIHAISEGLQKNTIPNKSPLLLLAPIGVATCNIGASTIHSKLRVPIKDCNQLEGT